MNKYQVNMVHPKQIVAKNLKGCKTTRTVTTFAQKNNVPWVWWKPTATQKVMLVDWTQFRTTWNKVATTTKNNFGYRTGTKNAKSNVFANATTKSTNRTTTRTGGYTRKLTTKTNNRAASYRKTSYRKNNYGTTNYKRRAA